MPQLGELIGYEGLLAQYRGYYWHETEPIRIDRIAASDLDYEKWGLTPFLGKVPWSPPGSGTWNGEVENQFGGRAYVKADDWPVHLVEHPIPRPRNGREYAWEWNDFTHQWDKSFYPRCSLCEHYHDPSFIYSDETGRCSAKRGRR